MFIESNVMFVISVEHKMYKFYLMNKHVSMFVFFNESKISFLFCGWKQKSEVKLLKRRLSSLCRMNLKCKYGSMYLASIWVKNQSNSLIIGAHSSMPAIFVDESTWMQRQHFQILFRPKHVLFECAIWNFASIEARTFQTSIDLFLI